MEEKPPNPAPPPSLSYFFIKATGMGFTFPTKSALFPNASQNSIQS